MRRKTRAVDERGEDCEPFYGILRSDSELFGMPGMSWANSGRVDQAPNAPEFYEHICRNPNP